MTIRKKSISARNKTQKSSSQKSQPLPSPDTHHPAPSVPEQSASVGTLLSTIQPQTLGWLWKQHLPLGKITTLEGDANLGKSLLALDLAARVSSGQAMPDGTPGIPGGAGVVLIVPDDALVDTLVPRLQQAGTNLDHIISIGTTDATDEQNGFPYRRPFRLPDDMDLLYQAIEEVDAKLVLIDPLSSLLDPKQASRDPGLRKTLGPLQILIEVTGTACLIVGHQTQSRRRRPHLHELRASLPTAASGLLVLPDLTDPHVRVLTSITSKLSAQADHLCFRINNDQDSDERPSSICWLGTSSQSLSDLLHPSALAATQVYGVVRQQILEALELFHPEALSIKALAEILPEISNTNLRWTLKRMTDDGQIQQPARGRYCALSSSHPSSEQPEPFQSDTSQPSQTSQSTTIEQDLSPTTPSVPPSQSTTTAQEQTTAVG